MTVGAFVPPARSDGALSIPLPRPLAVAFRVGSKLTPPWPSDTKVVASARDLYNVADAASSFWAGSATQRIVSERRHAHTANHVGAVANPSARIQKRLPRYMWKVL